MKTQKINFIVSEQLKQQQQKTDTASEPAASWKTIQPIPLDLMDLSVNLERQNNFPKPQSSIQEVLEGTILCLVLSKVLYKAWNNFHATETHNVIFTHTFETSYYFSHFSYVIKNKIWFQRTAIQTEFFFRVQIHQPTELFHEQAHTRIFTPPHTNTKLVSLTSTNQMVF